MKTRVSLTYFVSYCRLNEAELELFDLIRLTNFEAVFHFCTPDQKISIFHAFSGCRSGTLDGNLLIVMRCRKNRSSS